MKNLRRRMLLLAAMVVLVTLASRTKAEATTSCSVACTAQFESCVRGCAGPLRGVCIEICNEDEQDCLSNCS
jgi:hypothetical protein